MGQKRMDAADWQRSWVQIGNDNGGYLGKCPQKPCRAGVALSMQRWDRSLDWDRYLYRVKLRPRGQNPRPSFTALAISCSQAV